MGFSVQLVLVRGRPDEATLLRWALGAKERRPKDQVVLRAAPAWSGSFSLLFFDGPHQQAPLLEAASVPRLPVLPPDELLGGADRALLTIAFLARDEGGDAAYFEDSSRSDCGQLIVPGGRSLSWTEETCEAGRAEADAVLEAVFGAGAPTTNELGWDGGDVPYWSRRLSAR